LNENVRRELVDGPAVTVSYRGFTPMEAQNLAVAKHMEHFKKTIERITSCSIVVTSPGKHQKSGGMYDISIRARMPGGKEVDITKPPSHDPRYVDFYFALNDSFKRAERQLKDEAKKLRGDVKLHKLKLKKTDDF
jgi:Sigma 54 modulation protein / S30EA ribosomal protein